MQIAKIVPKTRTQNGAIFDYSIPAEILPYIRPGILVAIPFHGRKLEGIIVDLKLTSPIKNLKPILKIIDPNPVVDENHLKLAQWMSNYYLAPLGKTLFENITPPAIRQIKQNFNKTNDLSPTNYPSTNKKYLIIGTFAQRLNFYQKAIEKTLKQNRTIIILIPDLSQINFFKNILKAPYSIINSTTTKTQRWLEWEKIRQGKVQIVLGSTSAIFAPLKNLGLIIVDQEESETYKNDRSPRFHAVKVAEKLSCLNLSNLILGSLAPRTETYFLGLKNKYILKKAVNKPKKVLIVDLAGKFQAISQTLETQIEENLNRKKKVVLVLNRKGEGSKFACPDCRWQALCQTCNLPMVLNDNQLICYRCKKGSPLPEECPKCQNVHLKSYGLGIKKLKKFLQDFWPKAKIISLEEGETLKNNWEIALTTSFGLKFNFPSVGLIGIIDADQSLNFPDYKSNEKSFQTLFKFLQIGEQGIIQTNLPESPLIQALAQLDFEKFFLDELIQRQKNHYPPFAQLIRLLYKNKDENLTRENSKKIFHQLEKICQSQNLSNISLFGPAPTFYLKKNNYFSWHIILKIKPKTKLAPEISKFLSCLPKNWIVDIDPINLL